MTSNQDIVDAWFEYQMGKRDSLRNAKKCSVGADPGKLYSWGSHFTLVEPIRYGDDKSGLPDLWLLNGDRWSNSTSRHQRQVLACAEGSVVPFVVVPFSALDRAGVDRSTFTVHDKQDEQVVKTDHVVDTFDDLPEGMTYVARVEREITPDAPLRSGETLNSRTVWREIPETGNFGNLEVAYGVSYPPNHGDKYKYSTYEHLLGECVFSADVLAHDSLHRKIVRKQVTFLSGFDHGEREGSHYFLCELPVSGNAYNADLTLAGAYESLKPKQVKLAEEVGLDVRRQGDIFAVSTDLAATDRYMEKAGHEVERRGRLFDQRHSATRTVTLTAGDHPLVRGCLYHDGGEHRRVKLGDGKTWYRAYQNLVPHDVGLGGRRAWSIVSANLAVD